MTQARKLSPASPKQAARVKADIDRRLDPELFKALGDETRLTLLACVAKCGRPCSVTEIAGCCSVDLSVVSRHLAVLARAGILDARKVGRTVLYSVRHAELSGFLRALADAVDQCCPGGSTSGTCCDAVRSVAPAIPRRR